MSTSAGSPLLSPPPSHPATREAAAARQSPTASDAGSTYESPAAQPAQASPSLLSSSVDSVLEPDAAPPSALDSTAGVQIQQAAEALPAQSQAESAESDVITGLPGNPSKDATVQQILQQLEDIDLATFLARQTREFSEARLHDPVASSSKLQAPQWQTPDDLQPWEQSAYLARFEELLRCAAKRLPSDMVTDYDPEDADPTKFSVRRTRAGAERLYMLVPPSKVTSMRSNMRDLAYWRKPGQTAALLVVYCLALYKDLCPALAFTALILVIIKRRVLPPNATALRDEVIERRKLAKEAKQIGADFETRGQLTTLGSFIASTSNAASQGARGDPGIATDPLPAALPKIRKGANSHSKPNTITLAKEMGARFGPDAQVFMEDAANVGEKIRNLALFRDPIASWRILGLWSVIALSLFFTPPAALPRATFAGLGLHFFCLAYLRHRFPRYRRFFNPLHWILLGLPTDATAARLILHRRAASGQSVKTLRDFKHAEKQEFQQEPFEMPKFNSELSRSDNFKIIGSSLFNESKRRFGQAKDVLNSYSFDKDSDHAVGTSFFCFQGRTPGRVVLEESHLRFDGVKGFSSSKEKGKQEPKTPALEEPPGTPTTSDPSRAKLQRLAFADLVSVKKASTFGDPSQLLISSVDGQTYKLSKVADRGEAFLKILLKCPQLASVSG